MANPDPKTLQYFDNANAVPVPYGVNLPFNQEQKDVWVGYDGATGQLCITNYNRTIVLACYSPGAGGGTLLFNATEDKQITPLNTTPTSILPAVGIGSSIIPANFLTDGKKLSIRIGGTASVDDPDSLAFGLNPFIVKFGGQNIILSKTNGNFSPPNKAFSAMLELTYRSSGNILVATGLVSFTAAAEILVAPTPIVINPAIPNAVDVLTAAGGVGSGLVITTTIMSIESPTLIS